MPAEMITSYEELPYIPYYKECTAFSIAFSFKDYSNIGVDR